MYKKVYQYHSESKERYGVFRKKSASETIDTLIVFIHGGFWREAVTLDYLTDLVEEVTELNYSTWYFEYERVIEENDAKTILNSVLKALTYIP